MLKIISFFVVAYLLVCLILYLQQRTMLYFPSSESQPLPTEHFWLHNGQQRLKIWKLNDASAAVLYFGGNAEAVENNIADFDHLLQDHTVYIANYRGYGGSSGEPSEQALFDDALALYDHVKTSHASVSVIGRSLGSGVACFLASKRKVEKLVLVTPFDSMSRLAQTHYPFFPVKWLLKDRFESLAYAQSIDSATLLLLAQHDRVVPRRHSLQLASALQHLEAETHVIDNTQHNTISASPEYRQRLRSFMLGTH